MSTPGPGRRSGALAQRLRRMRERGANPYPIEEERGSPAPAKVAIDCGWGMLHFAQTYAAPTELADAMRSEGRGRRDIAFYIREPHVMLSAAPLELFLDPSHTYRLDLSTYRPSRRRTKGFAVRRMTSEDDAEAVNRIYATRNMVPVTPDFFWRKRDNRDLVYLVAEEEATGAVIGTVTGIDHHRAFGDRELGSSLWCLAVDPQTRNPGVGEALVRRLAEVFQARGRAYLDLSVLHDNETAIHLYEKLGFVRVPLYAIKRKNPINERLFAGPPPDYDLNPYAMIIVDEARRRGIDVEMIDAPAGLFRLTYGGRTIRCRESLTDLTSSVSMSMCDDKAVSRRLVESAGLRVPDEIEADDADSVRRMIERHGRVVVKPARGEQGRGISVGLTCEDDLDAALASARQVCARVLVEEFVEGRDLRLVVIDYRVVAAALRLPARVFGDGTTTLRELIEGQSRRRAAATGGESRIPLDAETERCVRAAGYGFDDVPPEGQEVEVRRTANLHTGGTIHDVTDHVHPTLIEAAVRAARAIEIPVVGVDFLVRSHREPDYVFIEANERPGLANHEPQPTAERFVDLLFPQSIPQAARKPAENDPETPCPA